MCPGRPRFIYTYVKGTTDDLGGGSLAKLGRVDRLSICRDGELSGRVIHFHDLGVFGHRGEFFVIKKHSSLLYDNFALREVNGRSPLLHRDTSAAVDGVLDFARSVRCTSG